jgi:DNA-binding NarL/FixJ family response regulator
MNRPPPSPAGRRLRVLLVGNAGAGSVALSEWLGEREMLEVAGPAKTAATALALAARFEPDVVLLDFHGLPAPIARTVSLFKELSPPPLLVVLTHDASDTMRRRCREAQADAVFDKTTELEKVASLLDRTGKPIGPSPAYAATPIPL